SPRRPARRAWAEDSSSDLPPRDRRAGRAEGGRRTRAPRRPVPGGSANRRSPSRCPRAPREEGGEPSSVVVPARTLLATGGAVAKGRPHRGSSKGGGRDDDSIREGSFRGGGARRLVGAGRSERQLGLEPAAGRR